MISVSVTRPIGHQISDIGPGGKETVVEANNWPACCPTCTSPAPHRHPAVQFEGDTSSSELIDPAVSRCPECRCSFGVHLAACSQFKGNL